MPSRDGVRRSRSRSRSNSGSRRVTPAYGGSESTFAKRAHRSRRSRSQPSTTSVDSRGRFSPVADPSHRSRNRRSISSQSRRHRSRGRDYRRNAYPGLPTPPKSFSYGSSSCSRHLPTKDLVDSDFLSTSAPRKYLSARTASADQVWRSKVRKIYQSTWTDIKGRLIDTHCHLDFLFIKISFYGCIDDYFKSFNEAFFPNFDCLITVFCNPISLIPEQFKIWSRILDSPKVYAACGIHPHASHYYTDGVKHNLIAALRHPKVKAVGECGIDRSHKNQIHVDVQARALISQLKLAIQFDKPVILHARDAYADTLSVVKKVLPADHRIHLHCYTDSWDMAREWMNHYPNTMFGFTPLLTFSNHSGVVQTIERLPMDRILLETDSPYFVPRELYQDTNLCHPGFVYCVAERIAKIKGISLEDVVTQTENNAKLFYDI